MSFNTRISLQIKNNRYTSWKTLNIQQSIVQIAGSFSFTTSNRYAGNNGDWGIQEGDECVISVDNQKILTGYIEEIIDGYDVRAHDVTFKGRSKTADLVDCCFDVFLNGSEFNNITVLQFITILCGTVGINVIAEPAVQATLSSARLGKKAIEVGDFLYDEIAKYSRLYGFLAIPTGTGDLLLANPATTYTNDNLTVGQNLKANSIHRSIKDRFSVYYVEGQRGPTSAFDPRLKAEGKEEDLVIAALRTRPLIILEDEEASDETCQTRADWESRTRIHRIDGFGAILEITVTPVARGASR